MKGFESLKLGGWHALRYSEGRAGAASVSSSCQLHEDAGVQVQLHAGAPARPSKTQGVPPARPPGRRDLPHKAAATEHYDPFFHARAINRPGSPESTCIALARFRARASGDLRREK